MTSLGNSQQVTESCQEDSLSSTCMRQVFPHFQERNENSCKVFVANWSTLHSVCQSQASESFHISLFMTKESESVAS